MENLEQNQLYRERIENGTWRPGILADYEEVVGAGMSTKELKEIFGISGKARLTGKRDRFDKSFQEQTPEERTERFSAGRIIARVLQQIAPEADPHNIFKTALVHGGEVVTIDSQYLLKSRKEMVNIEADGMVTNMPGVPLMMAAADCAPVGIYDDKEKAIGLFHSGWRGTLAGVVPNGIVSMRREFYSDPRSLRIFVGPYSGTTDYEVGAEVYEKFRAKSDQNGEPLYTSEELAQIFKPHPKENGKYIFDNGLAIKVTAVKAGVPEEQIEVSQHSTMNETELFSSERKEGSENRDSNIALIVLRPPEAKTHLIDGAEYPELQGGIAGTPIDKTVYRRSWDYYVDFEKSPTLGVLYEEIKSRIRPEQKPEELATTIAESIRGVFTNVSKREVDRFKGQKKREKKGFVSLEDYAVAGYGNCSQLSIVFALMIEKLSKDKIISGIATIEEAFWSGDFAAGGHVWASFGAKARDRIIVDIAQNFIGTPEEYIKTLERVRDQEIMDF
jgi:YfiH family protein